MMGLRDEERDMLCSGFSPEPDDPRIVAVRPPDRAAVPAALPAAGYATGSVITRWLCRCPIANTSPRPAMLLARALSNLEYAGDAQGLMKGMAPLGTAYVLPDSAPDFMPAIDLRAMAGGSEDVHALFAAALDTDREQLVRVCHGAVGEGVTVHLFLDGSPVAHGDYVRLPAGLHVLVMQTNSGKTERAWYSPDRLVSVRFDTVTEPAIAQVAAWRRRRWDETLEAARADEAALLAGVGIEPASVVGREGFIRAGRSGTGQWWLLNADGKPFYYRGMCSVNNRGGYGGRRKGDPPLSPARVRHWLRTMRAWGFNGLGSWTTREFFEQGMYYTEVIENFYEGPFVQGGEYRHGVVPDVFDPEWAARVERVCRTICAPLAEKRGLVGYFLDNERDFLLTRRPAGVEGPVMRVGEAVEERRIVVEAEPIQNPEKLGLLQLALSLPEDKPVAREAWSFVAERHGAGLAGLAAAWETPIARRLAINEMTVNGERLVSDAYLADEREFGRRYVRRYFEIATAAVRRHDPNHLIIGLRWAGPPEDLVLEEEARYCDIVSMNRYRVHLAEAFDVTYRKVGKPILIGECEPINDSFRLTRDPIEPPGGYDDADARCETRTYESMNRVFEHPGIVGYTFYAWKNAVHRLDDIRFVALANHRAVARRVARARPGREGRRPPLNGQIFINLVGAPRDILSLGMICRGGEWEPVVYGNCLRGKATGIAGDGERVAMAVEFAIHKGNFIRTAGGGSFRLELARVSESELEGRFDGTFDGVKAAGRAVAYVHRELTETEL
jgi:hypothetical protein